MVLSQLSAGLKWPSYGGHAGWSTYMLGKGICLQANEDLHCTTVAIFQI